MVLKQNCLEEGLQKYAGSHHTPEQSVCSSRLPNCTTPLPLRTIPSFQTCLFPSSYTPDHDRHALSHHHPVLHSFAPTPAHAYTQHPLLERPRLKRAFSSPSHSTTISYLRHPADRGNLDSACPNTSPNPTPLCRKTMFLPQTYSWAH